MLGQNNTKRPNSDDCYASIRDTRTGILHELKTDEKFYIGKHQSSYVLIEGEYISNRHCTINYENGQYVIYDNKLRSSTFINYLQLPDNKVVLKDGDIISYRNQSQTWELVYIFNISNSKKKSRVDIECTSENHTSNEKYKESIKKLQDQASGLETEKKKLYYQSNNQKAETKQLFNNVAEFSRLIKKIVIKEKDKVQKLIEKADELRKKIEIQQKLLDAKNIQQKELETFKAKVIELLEDNFICSICREVLIKASIANCYHAFCESCISQWQSTSNDCPVCRSTMQNFTKCSAVDNNLTNLYNILGGTKKEQRVALKNQRNIDGNVHHRVTHNDDAIFENFDVEGVTYYYFG